MTIDRNTLQRRADYTYTFNINSGRFGWLRLTPAYSIKIVDEILARYDNQSDGPLRVFDPFGGSATTALCAAGHGHEASTLDINPFLVWFGQVKTAHYDWDTVEAARKLLLDVSERVEDATPAYHEPPPIHNIERWWSPRLIQFLLNLRAAITTVTEPDSPARNLMHIAFCQTLIKFSGAAFNHQSMSFKAPTDRPDLEDWELAKSFRADVESVLSDAAWNPRGHSHVLLGDARQPGNVVTGPFDLVITSPPYANRMSYIRELRPYMYWLGYLDAARDAGELDWSAIGGTWGIATSRLNDWTRSEGHFTNKQLADILDQIANHGEKSAPTLANYVARYLDDIWTHFQKLPALLAPSAELHYIVGNSTFYDILLPTEQFYADMLTRLGFASVSINPIRKRNSKKALIEFDISARWRR